MTMAEVGLALGISAQRVSQIEKSAMAKIAREFERRRVWRKEWGKMTIEEANYILRPPLVFGDERQIEARRFLEAVEAAKDEIRACKHGHEKRTKVNRESGFETLARVVWTCDCCWDGNDAEREAAAALVREWLAR
jgi:hypothetical protein